MPAGVFTHSITTGYKSDEGTVTSVIQSFTGDAEEGVEDSLAIGTTNKEYDLVVTKAKIVCMCIYASKACTFKTNSSSTPQDTITIAAGQQVVWRNTDTAACPFSADITKIFVTNTDTAIANVKVRVLLAL